MRARSVCSLAAVLSLLALAVAGPALAGSRDGSTGPGVEPAAGLVWAGTVTDVGGNPLADAQVRVWVPSQGDFDDVWGIATTDDSGAWSISLPAAGTYGIRITDDGYKTGWLKPGQSHLVFQESPYLFKVSAGNPASATVLDVQPPTWTISGVATSSGMEIGTSDVFVTLCATDGTELSHFGPWQPVRDSKTGLGKVGFTVKGEAGTYLLKVSGDGIGTVFYASKASGHWSTTVAGATSITLAADPGDVSLPTMTIPKAPTVTTPIPRFVVGSKANGVRIPVRVSWSAKPAGHPIVRYGLDQAVGGTWTQVALSSALQTSATVVLTAGSARNDLRAMATDSAGVMGQTTGRAFPVALVQEKSSARVAYAGAWSTASDPAASGGAVRQTTARGASVTWRISAYQVAIVAARGPKSGRVKVTIGGNTWTVDLYAATAQSQRIVFVRTFVGLATRTIKISNLATGGRPKFAIDAFVAIQ